MRSVVAGLTRSAEFMITAALVVNSALADLSAGAPKIGVIVTSIKNSPLEEGFRDGLRELGYVEGKNIAIEWRRSTGTKEELRSLATDLRHSKVDLIVTSGSSATRAALQATTVPVVFMVGDPVGAGFAVSLARPGGNATGISVVSTDLNRKQLELLHELAPSARRIVYLMNPSNPLGAQDREAVQVAARSLDLELLIVNARDERELDVALNAIHHGTADGFLVSGDLFLLANKAKIARTVRKAKVPAMFAYKEYHEAGALMSYGISVKEPMRRLAVYVDKILTGSKAADLPIEQISKYQLIIDLRVTRELGLEVPQTLLLRADEVIR